MNMQINVTVDGAAKTYRMLPVDYVRFEREFEVSVEALADPDRRRMTHVFYLAWLCATRVGDTADTFDEWLEQDIELTGMDDNTVPFEG